MRRVGTVVFLLLASLVAASAMAEPRRERNAMEYRQDRDQGLSVREAADRAQRKHGGRVLAIDQDGFGGYRVKLLKNGEVRTVHIPP